MSQKQAKLNRKEQAHQTEDDKPIGQILINVYKDGSTSVHNFPPELHACMHIMADAMAYLASLFATQGQPTKPKEESRIITLDNVGTVTW